MIDARTDFCFAFLGNCVGRMPRVDLQVHQDLSQQDVARAQSVSKSSLCLDNPSTYGDEVAYWLDTEDPGKMVPGRADACTTLSHDFSQNLVCILLDIFGANLHSSDVSTQFGKNTKQSYPRIPVADLYHVVLKGRQSDKGLAAHLSQKCPSAIAFSSAWSLLNTHVCLYYGAYLTHRL